MLWGTPYASRSEHFSGQGGAGNAVLRGDNKCALKYLLQGPPFKGVVMRMIDFWNAACSRDASMKWLDRTNYYYTSDLTTLVYTQIRKVAGRWQSAPNR